MNEWRRIQKVIARNEGKYKYRFPLFEKKISGEEVKRVIREEWRICLPEPYKFLQHNNCLPCWKQGKSGFYLIWKHYPEQFWRAVEMEEKYGPYTLFKDHSLRELAEIWQGQKEFQDTFIPLFEMEESIPCMCAI